MGQVELELVYLFYMEKAQKINELEIQQSINENTEHLKEIEEMLKDEISLFKKGLELLEMNSDYLWHMNNDNEMTDILNKDAEEFGHKQEKKKYSEEQINKVNTEIEKMKKEVNEINSYIAELTLNKIQISHYIEEFEKLNERFRTNLLHVKPENLN